MVSDKNKAASLIAVKKQRDLSISAASGLVIEGDKLYVIADDGLHLHAYSITDAQYEKRIRLLEGELPVDKKARKKQKPDFEALVRLPAQPGIPHGTLLALGSGSKKNRQQGVLVSFHADGALSEKTHTLDFSALYATLPFEDTNIEGALVVGDQLVLMQRGNKKYPQSALVYCSLAALLEYDPSAATRHLPYCVGEAPEITAFTLPCIGDIPLGFTDGIALPNGNILFSAVAENTDDSFNDGACAGAAIGTINMQGEFVHCEYLAEPFKIEGIAFTADDAPKLYAVTDADDPAVPAALFEVDVPEDWLK